MSESNDNSIEAGGGARSIIWIVALFAFIAVLRIVASSDLHEGDQPKQADYVLDIVCNGNWIVQHHADGSIMSKPPLYNWLAAPLVMLFGAEDVFLKMPSLLAGLATALMVFDMARRRLGERAALWGCGFMLLTSMFAKQMYYARTDMLLTCFIVMQFWAIVRWEESSSEKPSFRSGWLWIFWIAAALGNLTKGPLAFLPHLALAATWLLEGRFKERYSRMGVWWGLPLALLPFLIWLALAYRAEPAAVYEHIIKAEVLDRFRSEAAKIEDKGADKSNRNFFYYLPHVIARALPASLFGLLGIWGAFAEAKNSAWSDKQRGMLRLLVAWFFTTLLFFSLVPSKRADRIFPAIPAFCLLAGWAFDGFLKSLKNNAPAARIEDRIAKWITVAMTTVFIVAGAGLIAFELGANFGPFKSLRHKVPAINLEALASNPILSIAAGAILLGGGAWVIGAILKRRAVALVLGMLACELALMTMYQLVFGTWMQTEYCQGSAPVCREVRKRARADGAAILVLAGSGPDARFYLLQFCPGILPEDAADYWLAEPHRAMYVVGTQPSLEIDPRKPKTVRRNPGGLEQAGISEAQRVPVAGVPVVGNAAPTTRWLGAVYVPERK